MAKEVLVKFKDGKELEIDSYDLREDGDIVLCEKGDDNYLIFSHSIKYIKVEGGIGKRLTCLIPGIA